MSNIGIIGYGIVGKATEYGFKDGGNAGVDGSFTTVDSKTVTVSGGIITAIV